MTYPTYQNLIGGHWTPAVGGNTFLNLNPADHEDVIGAFPASSAEDVDLAVAAAHKAFSTWRLVPAPKRAEILMRAGLLLQQRKEQYARDMTRENGNRTLGGRANRAGRWSTTCAMKAARRGSMPCPPAMAAKPATPI